MEKVIVLKDLFGVKSFNCERPEHVSVINCEANGRHER